jgi:hypothetical protein
MFTGTGITHFPSNVAHPSGTLRFPTHYYEYSIHLYSGKQLQSKYRARGRVIMRRKRRDYVRAQFDAVGTLGDGN